jgi:hypothetical protein
MGKEDGGGRERGGRRGEGRRTIRTTIKKRVGNIANQHNCMELRHGGGRNITVGSVAPLLHPKIPTILP